jgi:hypothetical protein
MMFLRLSSEARREGDVAAPFDILCGKDKTFNKHKGNQVFRNTIATFQDVYACAATKQDKMNITKEIVQKLRTEYGARFVKLHKGHWQEISDQMARDKVSHALRFAAKGSRAASLNQKKVSLRAASSRMLTYSGRCPNLAGESSATSSISSTASSSSSSVSSHAEAKDEDDSSERDEDATVESLFERQRLILKSLRFDDHLEEEIGVPNKRMSIIDQAIFLQKRSDTVLAISTTKRTSSNNASSEFDTLRSEDIEGLLGEPIDFHNSQEWAFDVTQ